MVILIPHGQGYINFTIYSINMRLPRQSGHFNFADVIGMQLLHNTPKQNESSQTQNYEIKFIEAPVVGATSGFM